MHQHQDPAIEAHGLTKAFGATRAVNGIDLEVPRGTVYGVLGPNGAGKTTTLRMLATLLRPDAGTARVLGHDVVGDPDAVRSRVSLTGQFASVDEDLTGEENLVLIARLWGCSRSRSRARARELLEALGLGSSARSQAKAFSGGMRRRLDIAASLVVTPDLLFLDEPTTGLDPRSRGQVWDVVRDLVRQGSTVLLTTQYLDEADQLADRIALVDGGVVVAEGTSSELKELVGSGSLRVRLHDPTCRPEAERILAHSLDVPMRLETDPAVLSAKVTDAGAVTSALRELTDAGIGLAGFALGQPTLDEVFLTLTGRPTTTPPTDTEEAA